MSAMEAGQLGQQLNHASQVAVPVAQVKRQPAADWSDWIFFAVGWICGVAWIAGVMRPLCRHPRFPAARNKAGWIANVIGEFCGPQRTAIMICIHKKRVYKCFTVSAAPASHAVAVMLYH